jgi:hypothetical protein
MRANIVSRFFVVLALLVGSYAHADKASLKKDLAAARAAMVAMREEKGSVEALKKETVELTRKIDAEADSIPGFKALWEAYKQTRDQEFIPAFDGRRPGDKEKAKALGTGIQKERYEKMLQLLQ